MAEQTPHNSPYRLVECDACGGTGYLSVGVAVAEDRCPSCNGGEWKFLLTDDRPKAQYRRDVDGAWMRIVANHARVDDRLVVDVPCPNCRGAAELDLGSGVVAQCPWCMGGAVQQTVEVAGEPEKYEVRLGGAWRTLVKFVESGEAPTREGGEDIGGGASCTRLVPSGLSVTSPGSPVRPIKEAG